MGFSSVSGQIFGKYKLYMYQSSCKMRPKKILVSLILCSSLWCFATSAKSTRLKPHKTAKFVPKKTTCKSKDLCNEAPDYPAEDMARLLRKHRKKLQYLPGTVVKTLGDKHPRPVLRSPDVGENLCRTMRYSVIPKIAYDTQNRPKYIVNVANFTQIIKYETCVNENESCYGNEVWPDAMRTFCKRAYTVIRLLSVSHSGKMQYAYFPVPSNCVCSYLKTIPYDFR
ncbi:unnamed protein product [Phyllotreta striolata]|uniref:Spaetzle domain-containing protein n=1 Tax=Phyllotreta striolata TaxID=444603 RepID=A0A9N9XMU5_PHYSR|nr:unnamed protein product [Phyllotreta striolata]